MATFRSNQIIESPSSVGSSITFLLLVANLQLVATSVRWTAPPPAWTQTDPTDIRRVDMSVVKGSTQVALRWNYTLPPGSNLVVTTFYITDDGNSDDIGIVSPNNIAAVNDRNDYRTRFDISPSEVATLIIKKVTEREDAVYQCKLTVVGNTWAQEIRVIVLVESSILSDSGNQTIIEGSNVTLFCNASGKPDPNVTWTVENGNRGGEVSFDNPWVIENVSRNDTGTYNCTAYNGVGNPVSRLLYVNVTYPAKIVRSRHKREREVAAQQRVSLDCPAEGNPKPTYTWTPCDPQQSVCHMSTLIIPEVLKDTNYSCRVENDLGSDTTNTSLFIASDVINVTMVITSEECTDGEYNQLWAKLNKTIEKIFAGGKLGYESVEQKNIRCESVIVDLALKFNSTVRESAVLSILRDAVKNKKIGDFTVSSITGTRDIGITSTTATTPTSLPPSTTWIIVGVVLGVAAALAVAGGVVWYVHKKRKCKKRDPKVHNNGSQGEAGGNVQDEGYVEVNKGYDSRANRQSGGGNTPSVPAVLYDTARTGNRGAVKEPALPQYAVVDKSKKKPKKPRPGELQYAELAEFSAGQGGQRSSTSPTNRPAEIQYADVNAM